MSKRKKLVACIATALVLLSCSVTFYLERTAFIHIYGYEPQAIEDQSGLSIKVRFQPSIPIRNEIPERMVGPPFGTIFVVNCPPNVQSLTLNQMLVSRCDGTLEDCRIRFNPSAHRGGVAVMNATINEGEWGEHVKLTAFFTLTQQNVTSELRFEFPLSRSHARIIRVP